MNQPSARNPRNANSPNPSARVAILQKQLSKPTVNATGQTLSGLTLTLSSGDFNIRY